MSINLLIEFTAVNEVRVVVKVRDVNDNAPRFIGTSAGRPIIAAAPSDASYGYSIIQLQVRIRK